jgi:hypothetical protein
MAHIDVYKLDKQGYDFLSGRVTLVKLRVGTYWDSDFWYTKTDIGTIAINIKYK